MNKQIVSLFLFILMFLGLSGQQNEVHKLDSIHDNTAFTPGEYLQYKVKYGFISGGIAEMRIDMEPIGYDWYYHVIAIARTSGVVGALANVHDRYESYFDITTGLPIKAVRDIREGGYTRYNEVLFRRWENTVLSLRSGTHPVPPNTMDILSSFYYARKYIFKNEFKKNDVIKLTTYFDDKLYDVQIRYKETKTVRTEFGKLECLRFVPVLDAESPFKKEEDMQVWFTNDGNFIPVRIRMDMPVGSVKCDLTNYKNVKNAFGVPYVRPEKVEDKKVEDKKEKE